MPTVPAATTRRYSAPALDKGLDILECLADAMAPQSQLEIATALARTPSEIYRMLMCLEERGYVMRETGSGKFRLTLRLYELSHRQNTAAQLRKAARLPMEMLADSLGQSCHLSLMSGPTLLVLMERLPSCRISLAVGEGSRYPVLQTTSGKLLLAQWPLQDRTDYLMQSAEFGSASHAEKQRLLAKLDELRGATHHLSPSGTAEGVSDLSVPVGVPHSEIAAALVISFLSGTRHSARDSTRYLKALRAAAAEINRNLGVIP